MPCSDCSHWVTKRVTIYEDGSEITTFEMPAGKGFCEHLKIEMHSDFHCSAHEDAANPVRISSKTGAPWQHWRMDNCPECGGLGIPEIGTDSAPVSSRSCSRCQGTGNVRHYDDGYIGEERTRLHPKERERVSSKPKCLGCGKDVEPDWQSCPFCGQKLDAAVQTEIVSDPLGGQAL